MKNKIALVTGVSRIKGIGNAICLELASRGYDIFFTYWKAYDRTMPWGVADDEVDEIHRELLNHGIRSAHMELDLSKSDSVSTLLNHIEEKLGPVSILINNATYSKQTSIDDLTGDTLDQHYQVNVRATTLLTAEFVQRFKHKSGGRIINLTSGQSLGKMPNELAYAMTKSAIEMMTTTLSSELMERGITINAVNPGPNDTGWMDLQLKNELTKRFPSGGVGTPSGTANLIGFLVSEEGSWITGQIIHSEGGFRR